MKPFAINEASDKFDKCNKREIKYLKKHSSSVNEGNKPYKCNRCEYRFEQVSHLYRHFSSVHDGVRYKCVTCDSRFTSQNHLNEHSLTVHEKKKITIQKYLFKCDKCDYRTDRKSHLNRHIASLHQDKKLFQCKMCDYRSSQKENLFRHISLTHDVEETYKCPICNSEFGKEQDFIKHVSSVHERKSLIKIPIVLDYSSSEDDSESKNEISKLNQRSTKQITKINSSKSDSSMENKSKLLNCKSCGLKFINANSLIKHIEKNHLKNTTISTDKQNSAKIEETKEPVEIQLVYEKHKNKSITSKPEKQEIFSCDICNSTFTQNSALTRHIELLHLKSFKIYLTKVDFHHNKKENLIKKETFKNICGTNKELQENESPNHQTDDNGIACEIFKDLENKLKNKDTPMKPKSESNVNVKGNMGLYQCNICNSRFMKAQLLKQHVESVHEGHEIFNCSICNSKFTHNISLTRHIELVHLKSFNIFLTEFDFDHYKKEKNINQEKFEVIFDVPDRNEPSISTGSNSIDKKENKQISQISDVHERKNPSNCEKCEFKTSTKHHMKIHMSEMHVENKKKKPFKCDTCYKSYTTKNNLKSHSLFHCKGNLSQREEINSDMNEGTKNILICNICGSSFKTERAMNRHIISNSRDCMERYNDSVHEG